MNRLVRTGALGVVAGGAMLGIGYGLDHEVFPETGTEGEIRAYFVAPQDSYKDALELRDRILEEGSDVVPRDLALAQTQEVVDRFKLAIEDDNDYSGAEAAGLAGVVIGATIGLSWEQIRKEFSLERVTIQAAPSTS